MSGFTFGFEVSYAAFPLSSFFSASYSIGGFVAVTLTAGNASLYSNALVLRFELIQLSLLMFDLSLLSRDLPLHVLLTGHVPHFISSS